ncbi:MAG TPA: polysaccharide deacetylase [Candidatus Borkfalkia stercoripullorum]|nr:polysaccharide deacetylase [Candidatus Borkfalkia stercoripullorum]
MKKFIAAALIALAAFAALHSVPARACSPPAQPLEIYLTFDDGPTDSTTPKVLDVLKKENVRATFFVVGRQIKGREKILKRTAEEGHSIGIHTYSHRYDEIYADKAALLKDIEKCRGAIKKVLPDYNKNLYRFPGGSFLCPSLREAVTRAGYRYYDWNASAGDAEGRYTAKQLFENAIRTSEGKTTVILLMHDGVGYKNTVRALPEIIRRFKNEGYVFKTL